MASLCFTEYNCLANNIETSQIDSSWVLGSGCFSECHEKCQILLWKCDFWQWTLLGKTC